MKNYRKQVPKKRCANCAHIVRGHDDWACGAGIDNAKGIDYSLGHEEFKKAISDYHAWADDRSVEWFGVCDLWMIAS